MSNLRLNISKLSEGVHEYSVEAQPGDIGLDDRFDRPVSVSATLEKTSRQLFLRVELVTAGLFSCDRCLDELRQEVKGSYTIAYVPEAEAADGLDEFEVKYIHADTNIVDLGEDVRQFVLLALPFKMLCREECAGLCLVCGVNKNKESCGHDSEAHDSRSLALKRFLEN